MLSVLLMVQMLKMLLWILVVKNIEFLVDTGATVVNIIDKTLFDNIKSDIVFSQSPVDKTVYAYGSNKPLKLLTKIITNVSSRGLWQDYLPRK